LGYGSGASGSYNLSGSGSLAAPYEYLGYSGTGTFTQIGGTNSVGTNLYFAYFLGAAGSYNLGGNGSLTVPNEYLGYSGSGSFTQSGGANSVGNGLYIGYNIGSSGSYNLSGGSLSVLYEDVGLYGIGSFIQSAGINSLTNNSAVLALGINVGGSGSYNLSGGSLIAPVEYVGYSGSGSFTQSGGVNSIINSLVNYLSIGHNVGARGSYSLSGSGFLTAHEEYVGNSGSGSFTQSGGTNSVTSFITLANSSSGSGLYNLSGSGYLNVPYEYIGSSGSGSFTQNGGTNSVGYLNIPGNVGGTGLYGLQNGYLAAANLALASQGSLNLSGGTLGGAVSVSGGQFTFSAGTIIGSVALGAGTLVPSGGTFGPNASLSQTGGTVAAGTLSVLGTFSYTAGAFNGRLVNGGTFLFSTSFFGGQGIENDVTITVPAGFAIGANGGGPANTLDNEGTIILTGGTLSGGTAAGSGGPIINNGLISGYGALSSGVGITNNVQIIQSGGNLVVSAGTAGAINAGVISLAQGYQLLLSGSTLTNTQDINLNSSILAGTGLLNNTSGNISGPGTITAPFQNSGGALSVPPGATSITQAFANSGAIQLAGITANLSGGSITNTGSIRGNGSVSNSINNTGTIEANGYLTLSGSVQNNANGLISVDGASSLVIVAGLANNNGIINLTGGVFDNNAHPLSNTAQISGYGTLRTGGLTNSASITFAGGTTTVNGPVTNASGGSINVSYSPAVFTGTVVNNGRFKITGTTVTYAGSFSNNGTYLSDPAANYFSSLANNSTGLVKGGNGDTFYVTDAATNAGWIDFGGTSTMIVGNGAGVLTQSAGTLELGAAAALSAGTVEIEGGIVVADGTGAAITSNLIYDSASASTYQGTLAGAANSLTVNNPAAILVLSGSNSYQGGTNVLAGSLVVTSRAAIRDGTSLTVGAATAFAPVVSSNQDAASVTATFAVPEPGTIALLATLVGLMALVACRGWRRCFEAPTASRPSPVQKCLLEVQRSQ
jgi:hypothetical protein